MSETSYLTLAERRVLNCLVDNAGRVVSHKALLGAVSPGNRRTSIDNLRHCIFHLRKKIEIDPALPRIIITHPRQEYSFAGKEKARWFPELEAS